MDKILEFIKEAKWFSISIGIFMVIWFGPNLLDRFEENKLEAERQARAEQREIVRQEQLKKEAIEKERREKREATEKAEREKRLAAQMAADKLAQEERIAEEKIRKEEEVQQKELEKKKLKELEIGLVCKSRYKTRSYNKDYLHELLIELILIRDLEGNIIDALSVHENEFSGTDKTTKEFFKANSKLGSYVTPIKVSDLTYSIYVNGQIETIYEYSNNPIRYDREILHVDRSSLNFEFDSTERQTGKCIKKDPELIRKEVEAHNLKNKSTIQL